MLCLSCNKNEIAWIFHSDRNIIKNMLMLNYCSYLPVSNVNKCGLFCLQFFDFSKSIRLLGYVAFLISFVSTVVDWMHCVIVSPSTSLYLTISCDSSFSCEIKCKCLDILGDVLHIFDNLI